MITTTEDTEHLDAAMLEAQKEIESIGKDSRNPIFNSRYASLTAVLAAIKDPLNSAGLVLSHAPGKIEHADPPLVTFIKDPNTKADKNTPDVWVETTAPIINVVTRITHAESSQWMEISFPVPIDQPTAQKVGSAVSYGRRYGLEALLSLSTEDDDGAAASQRAGRRNGSTRPPAEREIDWQQVSDRMRGEIAACQTVAALEEWNEANAVTSAQMPKAAFARVEADFLTRRQQLTMPKVDPAAQLDPQAPLDREPGSEG